MPQIPQFVGMKVAVCGGGNACHVMACDLTLKGYDVGMYMPYMNEAEKFAAGMAKDHGVKIHYHAERRHGVAQVARVSKDAKDVIPGAKFIFIAIPVNGQESTLMGIVPHCDADAVIVALPATGGFDWCARKVFKKLNKSVTIAGMAPMPYVCRTRRYGAEVDLFGTKRTVGFATSPPSLCAPLAAMVSHMLSFECEAFPTFLPVILQATNPIMHPGRMYGMLVAGPDGYWRDRKGLPRMIKFYDDCDDASNEWLHKLDAENQAIAAAFDTQIAGSVAGKVLPINECLKWTYKDHMAKWGSAKECFTTNAPYKGLGSPLIEVAKGYWVPDFKNRYFSEDIPYGLLVNRGLAELLGVPTPAMDTVIEWVQNEVGRKWLVDGRVNVEELPQASPQAYGLTLADLKDLYQVGSRPKL